MKTAKIRDRWKDIREQVQEKWNGLDDKDLKLSKGNLHAMIGRIAKKTGQSRREVEQFLDDLVEEGNTLMHRTRERAAEMLDTAMGGMRHGLESVGEQAQQGYEQTRRIVAKNPAQSILATLGLGLILGAALAWLLRGRD